ncbi:MAG: hypothetical protein ACK559_36650, partial [bacterium]
SATGPPVGPGTGPIHHQTSDCTLFQIGKLIQAEHRATQGRKTRNSPLPQRIHLRQLLQLGLRPLGDHMF